MEQIPVAPLPETEPVAEEQPKQIDLFEGKKGFKRAERKLKKGVKPTNSDLLMALVDIQEATMGMQATMPKMMNDIVNIRDLLEFLMQQIHMLKHLMIENKLVTEDQMQAAWEKFVIKPMEDRKAVAQQAKQAVVDKNIEELKKFSAEDAFYVSVIDAVRKHTFEPMEIEGKQFGPEETKAHFVASLLDETKREATYTELAVLNIPGLPAKQEKSV